MINDILKFFLSELKRMETHYANQMKGFGNKIKTQRAQLISYQKAFNSNKANKDSHNKEKCKYRKACLQKDEIINKQKAKIQELIENPNRPYDDEETDCTDFAHPAWWRGEKYSYLMCCERVNEFLDGKGLHGTGHKEINAIKLRIMSLLDDNKDLKTATELGAIGIKGRDVRIDKLLAQIDEEVEKRQKLEKDNKELKWDGALNEAEDKIKKLEEELEIHKKLYYEERDKAFSLRNREKELMLTQGMLESRATSNKARWDASALVIDSLREERDMWKNQAESLQKCSTFKKEYDPKWQKAYEELRLRGQELEKQGKKLQGDLLANNDNWKNLLNLKEEELKLAENPSLDECILRLIELEETPQSIENRFKEIDKKNTGA